jgi:hypothetical protein
VAARRVIRATAALLAVAAALPAAASARRDDKPVELYRPAEGATVANAVDGLAVDFICPVYHQEPQDDLLTQPTVGYHVILSTGSAVDAYGVLLAVGRVDERTAVESVFLGGHCNAAEDDGGAGLLPPEPGTYFWQAWRECATYVCPGGVEAGDVWPVTVKRTVCSVARADLAQASASLRDARSAVQRRSTAGRRARVERLSARVALLRSRLHVTYPCRVGG